MIKLLHKTKLLKKKTCIRYLINLIVKICSHMIVKTAIQCLTLQLNATCLSEKRGARVAQWVRSLDLTAHTSLSPIRCGLASSFVNYKKGCTRLVVASDKVYQLLAQGRWFSAASSTTKNWSPWYSWNTAESGVKTPKIKSNLIREATKTKSLVWTDWVRTHDTSTLFITPLNRFVYLYL